MSQIGLGPKLEVTEEGFHAASSLGMYGKLSGRDGEGYAGGARAVVEGGLMMEQTDAGNTGLTLQTLNADGTPKRPMNAFMIFARKRRPELSSKPENVALRTGEISKRLSVEWNAMEAEDKQFYLDQAKLLKETFNTKYPDYVYRRRPNNSKKKRKTECTSSVRDTESPLPDVSVATETPSPDRGDLEDGKLKPEHLRPLPEPSTSRYGHQDFSEPRSISRSSSSSRPSPYDYPSDRPPRGSIGRLPYLTTTTTADRRVSVSSPGSPNVHSSRMASHPYPSYRHGQPPSAYPGDDHGYNQSYQHDRGTAWMGPHPQRQLDQASAPMVIQNSQYSTSSHSSWPDTMSPGSNASLSPSVPSLSSVGSRSSSATSRSPNFPFPSSTPYYPDQQGVVHNDFHSSSYSPAPPPVREQPHGGQQSLYDNNGDHYPSRKSSHESMHGYEPRSYMSSPASSPAHPYTVPAFVQQQQQHQNGGIGPVDIYGSLGRRNPLVGETSQRSGLPLQNGSSGGNGYASTASYQQPPVGGSLSSLSELAYWARDEGSVR